MEKLKITEVELDIVKAYLQCTILIETLDEVLNESTFQLKASTKNYLHFLKNKVEPIINSMYNSNPKLYEKMTNELRTNVDSINNYFEII